MEKEVFCLGNLYSRPIYMSIDPYISEVLKLCGDTYKIKNVTYDFYYKGNDIYHEIWLKIPKMVDEHE